ncbi:trimeric LpxA-like protein [Microthyrium microscopicum]|uniref:Dynactin subunit 6 n=1 Tax=Microthyrium microscopicum TaxID=703497 RepID=A0A6A6URS7_9PEZI|nr:trimeric LpxA-like protein [Microthyrium microscopicum]
MSDPKRTSRSAPSKRTSLLPSAPKPPCKIDPAATIASSTVLAGIHPITIAAHAVLHPHARIVSAEGPVTIGEGCIVFEKATIGPLAPSTSTESATITAPPSTILGKNVTISTGVTIEGCAIGDGCVIEPYARIGQGAKVGRYCKVVAYGEVPKGAKVDDYTVVYGKGKRRVDRTMKEWGEMRELKEAVHERQVRGYQGLIPSNIAKWS